MLRKITTERYAPTLEERRTGVLGWEVNEYYFRPWGVTVLTRARPSTLKTTDGRSYEMRDFPNVCSGLCLAEVLSTWPQAADLQDIGLRSIGRRTVAYGEDVLAFFRGELPPPTAPSDEWVALPQRDSST